MTFLDWFALTLCFIGAVSEIFELMEKRGLALCIFCALACLVEVYNNRNTDIIIVVHIGNNSIVLSQPSLIGRVESHQQVRTALEPSFTTQVTKN